VIPLTSTRGLAAATVLATEAALLHQPVALGDLLVLWFMAVVPGTLVVDWTGLPTTGWERCVIVIATSFAVDTLLTVAMLYAGVWTPRSGTLVLAALCGALLAYGGISRVRVGRLD
jgi:hypothetical protein